MKKIIQEYLGLNDIKIVTIETNSKNEIEITIESTLKGLLIAILKWVCSDMYEGFINSSKEVFGDKVRVVIDRFHAAKLYCSKVDAVRKQGVIKSVGFYENLISID